MSAQLTRAQREFNGLDRIADQLIDQPRGTRYAVVAYEVKRVTDEIDEGVEIPTVQISHIEPVDGVQAERVREILGERYQDRTGKSLEGDPTLFDVAPGESGPDSDAERVPEPSGDELMARRAERKAAGQPAFSGSGEPL
jgi:sirohydrochlorin ferrochelatase